MADFSLVEPAPPLGRMLAIQTAIHGLMALGGIMVVRLLDTDQYAYYAIAMSAVTALTQLSNSGIVDGMTAIGGRTLDAPARLVATALAMRRSAALVLGVPVALLLTWLLGRNGASWQTTSLLVAVFGLANAAELHFSILLVVPWLAGRAREIQQVELAGAAARLVGIVTVASTIPRADIAVACGTAGILVQLGLAQRLGWSPKPAGTPDPAMLDEIRAIVRRQWLNEVNLLLQPQLTLVLLTMFSATSSVAAYAALGRIALVFTIILATLHRGMLATYARAQDRTSMSRLYRRAIATYLALAALPLAIFLLVPHLIQPILGPNYAALTAEFRLFAVNAMIGTLATLALWLNNTRGWILPGWFTVPYQTAWLAVFVAWFGADTLRGMIAVGIGVNLALLAAYAGYGWVRVRAWSS